MPTAYRPTTYLQGGRWSNKNKTVFEAV